MLAPASMSMIELMRAQASNHTITKEGLMGNARDQVSKAAHALSELGAAKGGDARAKKLSPEERSEIAQQAADYCPGNQAVITAAQKVTQI